MPAKPALYPLLLRPALHTRVWGGRRLAALFGRELPTDEPYGESWELHDSATVANGPLAGRTLGELLADYGQSLTGPDSDPSEGFPLLAKFLDAADWLSVQVHPDDAQARELEGDPRGKTEAWVILAADPGAKLVIGVRPGTTREQMAAAIRENRLETLVVYAEVRPGDVLYIAANTVHALGPGLLIYEIQQSSDVTYRLYDWGRMGLDGRPRQLHIEKGVQVSNLTALPQITRIPPGDEVIVVEGPYFRTVQHTLNGAPVRLETEGRFHALTCTEGRVSIGHAGDTLELAAGATALVPASVESYTLGGRGRVLRSLQND